MSQLVMIRHGQAGRLGVDYDRLSPLGERQARALAEFWLAHGAEFDRVYTGGLIRQIRTAEVVAETFRAAGRDWPAPERLPDLNEYDADAITGGLMPELAAREPRFAELAAAAKNPADEADRYRNFQRMLEAVMAEWVKGGCSANGFEPWPKFRDRVRSALRSVMSAASGKQRVAVFTSGGPIGVAVQTALGAPDAAAMEINWRVRNGSVTEFVFSGGRVTLDAYNSIAHLRDRELWTYR